MRLVAAFACTAMLICLGVAPGHAQTRVALVIGNSAYQNVPALPNPTNDASDVAASLERLGFTVRRVVDGTFEDMRRGLRDFATLAHHSEMAVVFFAGHGMEIGGENWLIPVDAELKMDVAAEQEAISLRSIVPVVGGASKLALVMLDACRNSPFSSRMRRSIPTRAVDRGLARVEPTGSVLVAYAAKDGTTANDGTGRNSPFAAALLKNIETPGLEINYLFRGIREEVFNSTGQHQEPVVYGALPKDKIYLKPPSDSPGPNNAGPAVETAAQGARARAWAAVKDTTSIAVLDDFIRRFGDSIYGTLARDRRENLLRAAAVVPPIVPHVPASPCGAAPVTVSWSSRAAQPLSGAEECALKPKDVFKECDKCPEMVVMPAGSFMMGSPKSEVGRNPDEDPQHAVTIGKSFAVGRFHVTVDQFAAFVAETGYDAGSKCYSFEHGKWDEKQGISWRKPGFTQAGSHAAVCLNWNDAKAYAGWLAKKTGKNYRLLTEAEWEYAARAGTTTRYSFGDDEKDLCHHGNGADHAAKSKIAGADKWTVAPCSDGHDYTAPAGSFLPNGFGLYDMHGNALQWVEDCRHDHYQGAPSDGSAWVSGDCSRRVRRGGSWGSYPGVRRAANRGAITAVNRYDFNGFRLARTF